MNVQQVTPLRLGHGRFRSGPLSAKMVRDRGRPAVDHTRLYAKVAIESIARMAGHNNKRVTGDLPMFAKINHLAICTMNYATNARFYQALFGMKAANTQRPARAAPVGDGQIGRASCRERVLLGV